MLSIIFKPTEVYAVEALLKDVNDSKFRKSEKSNIHTWVLG